jgi:hypothetical protein
VALTAVAHYNYAKENGRLVNKNCLCLALKKLIMVTTSNNGEILIIHSINKTVRLINTP